MNRASIIIASALLVWLGAYSGGVLVHAQRGLTDKLKLEEKTPAPSKKKPKAAAASKLDRFKLRDTGRSARNLSSPGTAGKPDRLKSRDTAKVAKPDAEVKVGKKEALLTSNKPELVESKPLLSTPYSIRIKTNVQTGRVSYAIRNDSKRVKDIQDGSVLLDNLSAGACEIEVSANEDGYKPLRHTLQIGAEPPEVSLPLERYLSESPFGAKWAKTEEWEIPAGWRIEQNKLVARGPGVALPRDKDRRHYADFKLLTKFRMDNDKAVSFALRARDERNYYLIQITGGKADPQYTLRGFVVKDGVRTDLFPSSYHVPVKYYDRLIANGAVWPELTIECVGNKFTVYLGDSEGPEAIRLAVLEDPNNHFLRGAPGIAVRDDEQQMIEKFQVIPPTPKNTARLK